jgi:hypothetical protein
MPPKSIVRLLVALGGAAMLAGCVSARSDGPPRARAPDAAVVAAKVWDLDGDGTLTCDEWKTYAGRMFDRADKNRDGFLSRDEFLPLYEQQVVSFPMSMYDQDADDRLSRAEFVNRPHPLFTTYDKDHDCRITPAEIAGGPVSTAPPRERRGPPKKNTGGPAAPFPSGR